VTYSEPHGCYNSYDCAAPIVVSRFLTERLDTSLEDLEEQYGGAYRIPTTVGQTDTQGNIAFLRRYVDSPTRRLLQ